jgi:hypothetical protein
MNKFIQNILLIIAVCLVAYIVFRSIGFKTTEGMSNAEESENSDISTNHYGGNAVDYAANLKTKIIKLQDRALVHKYRPDYENVILHLDELTDHLMLQTAMSVDPKDPKSATEALNKIASLNNSKAGLNNIMKFIDGK